MRQLATIQRIDAIDPIPGRDKIGLAHVLGWNIVVAYKDFIPGDMCVYVEIDSVMPERPEFEFLRSKKFRIKTMKMAGVVSQGICFPLSILPDNGGIPYEIGQDVTELLGVTKYDEYGDAEPKVPKPVKPKPPLQRFMLAHRITRPLAFLIWGGTKRQRQGFPEEVAKSDEVRIQNCPWVLANKEDRFEVHEKIDGQSGTFLLRKRKGLAGLFHRYEFVVCSRNMRKPTPDGSSWWRVAEKYGMESALRQLIGDNKWVCIQGEVIGPGIQGNPYKLNDVDLYCFNLIYPSGKVDSLQAETLVALYGLKWVPLVAKDFLLPDSTGEMLDYAEGTSQLADVLREGVVVRNYEHGISFKAVANSYLLKHDK